MTRSVMLRAGIAATVAAALVAAGGWYFSGSTGGHAAAVGVTDGSVAVLSANMGGSGPGALLSANTMPGLSDVVDHEMRAARVVYRSTSGDGQSTVVSGSVFIPTGEPPDGGWPVISYGHGTTGFDKSCAPSSSDSLLGYAAAVGALVRRGYAVALSDYQGIGAPGVHPYTDSTTAGRNMIDAVRALRATFKDVSNRWGAFGGSEGGGAAWAADEQARTYAPELTLVGAVAVSPTANLTGLVGRAQRGTLTVDQEVLLAGIVDSLSLLYPDLERDDYRHPGGVPVSTPCSGSGTTAQSTSTDEPDPVKPNSPGAAARLEGHLADWALPRQPLSAPLYVWYGGVDPFIDAPWTADAIQRACRLGGTVAVVFAPDKGHGDIDYDDQFNWLTERFAEGTVANACA